MAFKKRYILAEDAEERVVSLFRKERNDAANIFNTAIDACQSIILDMYDNAPDVVEVVRCKGCRWYDISHPYGTVIPDAYHCKVNDRFYASTHYCAYGERREKDE